MPSNGLQPNTSLRSTSRDDAEQTIAAASRAIVGALRALELIRLQVNRKR